ncbi:MAG: aminoacetone oxidase family FAD-binding enzyme [Fimbriimonadaceae bacterium]|nr:aminoacetone oxidase family FAD-binding enzyme [Fimbriimonadaceae bacterium]
MPRSTKPAIVIGAGAAGIIAAWKAASDGAQVILLEKTKRIGTKILISGGGKCNITHDGPLEEVLRAFRPHEARFIRPACYRFRPQEIVEMLTSRGLDVYTRPDGRIFPVHQTAKDVVAILRDYLRDVNVDVRFETPVLNLETDNGLITKVVTANEDFEPGAVVLSVGGSSYPNSGTTGDGWPWAESLGHTVVPILAALAPITLRDARPELAGVALRDCILRGRQSKEFVRWRGDLLFTHRGVSGPTCLGISREVSEVMVSGVANLEVDVVPDRSFELLTEEFLKWSKANPKKRVETWVESYVPKSYANELMRSTEISSDQVATNFAIKLRNRLMNALKGLDLGPVQEVVLDKGEVVAGGISLDEVDPKTMQSHRCSNLFLCGEVLDIAGPVGGYNLQAAFATGFVAGEMAANLVLDQ